MFEKREFIEQILYDDLLRFAECKYPYDKIKEFFNQSFEEIPDDYDMIQNFGLLSGDSKNARNHLFGALKSVYQNQDEVKRWSTIIEKDFRNWLKCIDIFDYDKELRIVIYIIVCLGCGECVCKQMEHEYQYLSNNRVECADHDMWKPAYMDLYMKCGDYCLFVKGDDSLAMRFYNLAACDWYGLYTEPIYAEKISEKEKQFYNRIRLQAIELNRYCNFLPTDGNGILGEAKRIAEIYNRYTKYRKMKYTNTKEKLKMILDFAKLREKTWNSSDITKKRVFMVISHRLCEDSIADIIVTICAENIDSVVENQILSYLQRADRQKYAPIQHFVQLHRDNPDILRLVYQLMRTSICIDDILKNLRVTQFDQELAYYTSLKTLCYMLPNWNTENMSAIGRFAVMNIAYMNDPNEGKVLNRFFRNTDKTGQWAQFMSLSGGSRKSIEYPYVFMKCFTTLVDDLPMWEMYGDKADGCCVILNNRTFMGEENEIINQIYQVCYLNMNEDKIDINQDDNTGIKDTCSIESAIEELRDIGSALFSEESKGGLYHQACLEFVDLLNQICYLFKSNAYKHEQEVRLLYVYPQISKDFLHTDEKWPKLFIRPEFAVHMKEIILGPKRSRTHLLMPYLQEQIAKMCNQNDTGLPKITMSGIQYQ